MLFLAGCERAREQVEAADYDAYWLWAGVKPQPVLDSAKTIYILEGEVRGSDARLVKLRAATPRVDHADIWIVYRVETLEWDETIVPQILADLKRWKDSENRVSGIQIDFDAATKGLAQYAEFLNRLNARLPGDCKLSVTGLLDWSSNGDSASLNSLGGVVDEVVLQTYQGRHSISGYQEYLGGLDRLRIPFRIGLVQNGEWQEPRDLASNPAFKGYVVFLLNPPTKNGPGNPGPHFVDKHRANRH